MVFEHSARSRELLVQLRGFMREHVYPGEAAYRAAVNGPDRWKAVALLEPLKQKARAAGLWNLFLPDERFGAGLSNLEYAPLAEEMGRVFWSAEIFNCSAPDTGNMELLAQYGSVDQQSRWLAPLRGFDRRGTRWRC